MDKLVDESSTNKLSYWKRMLKSYEERNASLERRRDALVERVRFMECTLPSLLVGFSTSNAYGKRRISDGCSRVPENPLKSAEQEDR